jgi:hypothetical protein
MVRKSLGYVELQWTCPHCGTLNPGPNKFCNGCGAPMADDVEFEQPTQEELLKDEEKIARAKAGPDVHCPYCGSRNAGDAQFCGACGGGLEDAQARASGKILGAHRAAPADDVVCPSCGTANAATARHCVGCGASLAEAAVPQREGKEPEAREAKKRFPLPTIIGAGVLLCLLAVVAFVFFGRRSEDLVGTVKGVEWSRSIPILAQEEVEDEGWREEIPAQAQIGTCQLEYHHTQDEPAPNSEEVCGTPYTIDSGSGYGEVVQDCVYEVHEEWCTYTDVRWEQVDVVTVTGDDLQPIWPEVTLGSAQREGEAEESYRVFFDTDEGDYTYFPSDAGEFSQFIKNSEWVLKVNPFDQVLDVESVQ